ncbi:hypothetical protein GCM10027592_63340 [Spirosoma flavus]
MLVEVARLLGMDREKADKVLCSLFMSSYVEVAGRPLVVVGSTASLDGFEASDFYAKVRAWVQLEYGVKLSEPDPMKRSNKKKVIEETA